MSFEIIEERTNPLMGRREAKLMVHHQGSGTPDRLSVRRLVSDHFKAPMDNVYVRSIATRTGGSSALCAVEIYDNKAGADRTVPAYLKNRNLPKEQRTSKSKKTEEAKPTPPQKSQAAQKPQPRPVASQSDKSRDATEHAKSSETGGQRAKAGPEAEARA